MEKKVTLTEERMKRELAGFPPVVTEEFEKAWSEMSTLLNEGQMAVWAQTGMELAQQAVRSWEAASEYFRVSPQVLEHLTPIQLMDWAQCGSGLCHDSPTLAIAYFRASSGTVSYLKGRKINGWADMGRSFYKGTWKSSTLACKFYASSPGLVNRLTFPELERFVAFLDALSHRSYDLSGECLSLGQQLFPLPLVRRERLRHQAL